MQTPQASFMQRFGFNTRLVLDDFPMGARYSLVYLLRSLLADDYVEHDRRVLNELARIKGDADIPVPPEASTLDQIEALILNLDWKRLYAFCERVYSRLICEVSRWENNDHIIITSLDEARRYYEEELNTILSENGIGYAFIQGQFQYPGRVQTQKLIQRVGAVLSQPRLAPVAAHYYKSHRFFQMAPAPDTANCVKEALCALEACVEVVTGVPASNDFDKAVRQLQGNEPGKIPPAIASGMVKLAAYRGAGQGVAHAALQGSPVTPIEAELVMNLVASYITYLADSFPEPDDIPF